MLILRGAPALSDFRCQKLLNTLQSVVPEITGLIAEFQHFVKNRSELTDPQAEVLGRLLTYGPTISQSEPADIVSDSFFLVVPRPGTISPWSSKASDIAHNCGLESVQRIERGISYRIFSSEKLSAEQQASVVDNLHDRMTEAVLSKLDDAGQLFVEAEPAPLTTVPVLTGGRNASGKSQPIIGSWPWPKMKLIIW